MSVRDRDSEGKGKGASQQAGLYFGKRLQEPGKETTGLSMRRTAHRAGLNPAGVSLLLTFLLAIGCSINSSNPAGFEFTGRVQSDVRTDTLTVTGADTSWSVPLQLNSSIRLFVGAFEGFESLALIRFTDLPAGAEIVSATLIVRGHSTTTSGDSTEITLEVSPVSSDWDTTWTGENRAELVLGSAVAQRTIIFDTIVDTIGFVLPSDLVQGWVDDSSAAALGIAVSAISPAPFLVNLYSSEISGSTAQRQPRLVITYIPAGESGNKTSTVTAEIDLSLLTYDSAIESGELWTGRGAPFRTRLTFDVSHLPAQATINRAILKMGMRSGLTLGAPLTLTAALSLYDEPWTVSDGTVIDAFSLGHAVSVGESDSTLSMVITSTVASQILREESLMHIIVVTSYENLSVGLVRFWDSSAAPERRARIELTYSLPPGITP
ncbi:DNRLRE domain-containing protein [Gemmatimonadota bacterium]